MWYVTPHLYTFYISPSTCQLQIVTYNIMGKYCCVVGCTADERKFRNIAKYPWMAGVTFHRIPGIRQRALRSSWIEAIKRDNTWRPNYQTSICSRHFVDKGPSESHPVPSLFPHNNFGKAQSSPAGNRAERRAQKKASSQSSRIQSSLV